MVALSLMKSVVYNFFGLPLIFWEVTSEASEKTKTDLIKNLACKAMMLSSKKDELPTA
ncbi:MAG TPA: hypothetical protein VJ951_05550 [Bacteroidales bacterium]|nr:hypothetical protein [Bacteroidales bacterium]